MMTEHYNICTIHKLTRYIHITHINMSSYNNNNKKSSLITPAQAAIKLMQNDPAFVKKKDKFRIFEHDFASDLNFQNTFILLLFIRIIAAITSHIRDCDETFNYWEPTHYLLKGYGMQTWEYSPTFALRSYAYVFFHVIFGMIVRILVEWQDKVLIFYAIRIILGVSCAYCEAYFYQAVCYRFGRTVGRYTLLFTFFSSGMYFSSVAYVPSSYAMYTVLLSFAAWFYGHHGKSIVFAALGVILSTWPYIAVIFLPLSFDALYYRGIFKIILWALKLILYVLVPMILIDSFFYGKCVFTVYNIVHYNVFRANSILYGVEDWKYYLINGFLNFSFCFPLALVSFLVPLLVWLFGQGKYIARGFIKDDQSNIDEDKIKLPMLTPTRVLIYISPLYIWFFIMESQPHKEERFLYVIYPLISLCSALSFVTITKVLAYKMENMVYKSFGKIMELVKIIFIFIFIILSVSRTTSEIINFGAPLKVYRHLYHDEIERHIAMRSVPHDEDRTVLVCVGKEWYRYPASFFLSSNSRLAFVEAGFKGQLPQPYFELEGGTRLLQNNFNDMNLEETTRYIPKEECHYLIDMDIGESGTVHQNTERWEVIYTAKFLNSGDSPRLSRVFYIPYYSNKRNKFFDYKLLRNKNVVIPRHKHIHHHVDYDAKLNEKDPPKPAPPMKKRTGLTLQLARESLPGIVLDDENELVIEKGGNVLLTKPGKDGYWNREIAEKHPRLLFVYGENHRDFLKMKAYFDVEHGELRPQWHYTDQKRTQGNIRGEPNAFPIRTSWYHAIPGSDAYQNWFNDRELPINSDVIREDIDRIVEAWKHGTYDFVLFGHKQVGTGVANLPQRAPKTYKFLLQEIDRLKSVVNNPNTRKIKLEEHPVVKDMPEEEGNQEL